MTDLFKWARRFVLRTIALVKSLSTTHKKLLVVTTFLTVISVYIGITYIGSTHQVIVASGEYKPLGYAYKVVYDGEELCYVLDYEDVFRTKDLLLRDYEKTVGRTSFLSGDLSTVRVLMTEGITISEIDNLTETMASSLEFEVGSFTIMVDGVEVASLASMAEATEVLERFKERYISKDAVEVLSVEFLEQVEVIRTSKAIEDLIDSDLAYKLMRDGTDEERIYEVKRGDTLSGIARSFEITQNDILKANDGINPNLLQVGQKLSLIVPKPLATVVTVEKITYNEFIPFDTAYEKSDSLFKGETRTRIAGRQGVIEKDALIYKVNGVEDRTQREVVAERHMSNPTTRVIMQGTKDPPPAIGTGVFVMPYNGNITSFYGPRWGNFHTGIDIGAPYGEDIRASDGGVVIFAGYRGSYGNLVIIDHGAGYSTYYAHASTLLVKTGEKVFQGQLIGRVGTTGFSTGPHIHFEIRKFDEHLNPLNLLRR